MASEVEVKKTLKSQDGSVLELKKIFQEKAVISGKGY